MEEVLRIFCDLLCTFHHSVGVTRPVAAGPILDRRAEAPGRPQLIEQATYPQLPAAYAAAVHRQGLLIVLIVFWSFDLVLGQSL